MTLLSKGFAAFAAAALLMTTTASAADALIAKFTVDNVKNVLTSLGAQDVKSRQETDAGKKIDIVSFSSGDARHVAILTVCDANGCLGLSMLTIWDGGEGVSYETVNKFNASYHFGRGFRAGSALAFGRYAISDGGVTEENVRSNIGNFISGSKVFQKFIQDSAIVSSLTPGNSNTAQLAASPGAEVEFAIRSAFAVREVNRFATPVRAISTGTHSAAH